MTPERWRRIEEIFHEAADLSPDRRAPFLNQACADDTELRCEIDSLLAHEANRGKHIAAAIGETAETLVATHSDSLVGQRIGSYRVTDVIGQGGMGSVYVAVRDDDQYQKKVAIKLVKKGMDKEFILRRFRYERQILANLEHPNIAHLIDGGATEDGLPYFVMEYIEGQNIRDYCESHQLSIPKRLKLFHEVCSAVQYAHRNLIVHRDIKPSNIVVTKDGVPKLLDFGIAKLLDPSPTEEALTLTSPDMRMMTPDYASPEQIMGLPVTTASDIYSLGVVFYELLTGQRPYKFKSYSMAELERAISQTGAEKPSVVVARTTKAQRLSKQLAGDLDNIALMAIRKEPERRYQSVEQMAEDIRRHVKGLPVIARRDTVGYRARKFLVRNMWGVAAAGILVMSLVGGIVATTYQARRAERRFQQVRKLANTFLFDLHDKIQNLQGSTEARELVVKTAQEYLDSLSREAEGDPSLELELAEAYLKVGDVQGNQRAPNLGHMDAAMKSYRKALGLTEKLAARDSANLNILRSLGASYYKVGDLQVMGGDVTGGKDTLRQGVRVAETVYAKKTGEQKDFLLFIHSSWYLGDAQLKDNDVDAALGSYQRSLELCEHMAGKFPGDFAKFYLEVTLTRIGEAMSSKGDLNGAIDKYQQVLLLCEALVKSDPSNSQYRREWRRVQSWLGGFYGGLDTPNLGDKATALDYYRKSLATGEELVAADPKSAHFRYDLASCYAKVADIISDTDPAEGAAYYRKGLSITRDLLESSPKEFRFLMREALILRSLAVPLKKQGDYPGALENLRQSLAILQSLSNTPNEQVPASLHDTLIGLGDVLLEMGDMTAALENYRQALAIAENQAADKPSFVYSLWRLADSYTSLGKFYSTLGSDSKSSAVKRIEHWREARAWYQKSFDVWDGWGRQAVSSVFDTTRRDQAVRAIAECDAALARLGG